MSHSSLYVIDKEFYGSIEFEYSNSWLFSPIIWDVLLDKYMKKEIQTEFGYRKNMIRDGNELHPKLNDIINNCNSLSDRICWELSNQQIFHTKDKDIIIQGIKHFLSTNNKYHIQNEEKTSYLNLEHIIKRFTEIADDIKSLDENESPYFILKNTSCDSSVEFLFTRCDEEEYVEQSLSELNEAVIEFVSIENNTINFIDNLSYFNKLYN